jgi:hypothetical protein
MFGLTRRETASNIIRDEAESIVSTKKSFPVGKYNFQADIMEKWSVEVDVHKINVLSSVVDKEFGEDKFFSQKFMVENVKEGIEKGTSEIIYAYRVIGRLAELYEEADEQSQTMEGLLTLSSESLSRRNKKISKKEVYEDLRRETEKYHEEGMFKDKL